MNRKTIQKVIDELNTEQPRLDYVKGILETLIDSLPEDNRVVLKPNSVVLPPLVNVGMTPTASQPSIDESQILETSAMAVLNRIDKNAIKTE